VWRSTADSNWTTDVDVVLVLLTAGVLSAPSLAELQMAIKSDGDSGRDRIRTVFSKALGWSFGCAEQEAAPDSVKACLASHEALTYRPKDPSGPNRHEFAAMTHRLWSMLDEIAGV
jgi:hypothetical protein